MSKEPIALLVTDTHLSEHNIDLVTNIWGVLKKYIKYDRDSGLFYWIKSPHLRKNYVGKEVGWLDGQGYRKARLFGNVYKLHILAWIYEHKEIPYNVRHINGKRDDNRIDNLSKIDYVPPISEFTSNDLKKELNIEDELWRPLIAFEELYEISNFGKLISKSRKLKQRNRETGNKFKDANLVTPRIHNGGYLRYSVRRKDYYIHRLVYEHFVGKIPEKYDINHIDGNKTNNHVSNLELANRRANHIHAIHNGLVHKNKTSKYVGVCRGGHKNKRWSAYYYIGNDNFHLGTFDTEEEAYEARLKALEDIKYKGKYK